MSGLPPGPRRWPIIGSIPSIGQEVAKDALRLSKEVDSDIIHVWLGPVLTIFLNSLEAVEDAMSGDELLDRPETPFFLMRENTGLGNRSGKVWWEHRLFLESLLKDSGATFEQYLHEEIRHLQNEIVRKEVGKFDISPLIVTAASNVIVRKLVGKRYEYSDESFLHVCTRFSANLTLLNASPWTKPLNIWPSLRHLPGNLFYWRSIQNNIKDVQKFLQVHIEEHTDRNDDENRDFLDAYIAEKKRQDPDATTFTDYQILNVLMDLLSAGGEDIATTIRWAILYMIKYPEIQTKVQDEIDKKIDRTELPKFEDRKLLPYTEATILEVQRAASQVPLALPHTNLTHDITVRSFKIPKGALVFPNTFAIHRDPKIWAYPNEFNPRNFLDEDGKVAHRRGFLPNSFGKRNCPGLRIAQMELFVFFASLLQLFELSTPEGVAEPDVDAIFIGSNVPKPFKVCVKPRFDVH